MVVACCHFCFFNGCTNCIVDGDFILSHTIQDNWKQLICTLMIMSTINVILIASIQNSNIRFAKIVTNTPYITLVLRFHLMSHFVAKIHPDMFLLQKAPHRTGQSWSLLFCQHGAANAVFMFIKVKYVYKYKSNSFRPSTKRSPIKSLSAPPQFFRPSAIPLHRDMIN
jgi:hypothetical protein